MLCLPKQQNTGKPTLLLSGKHNADLPFQAAASGHLAALGSSYSAESHIGAELG